MKKQQYVFWVIFLFSSKKAIEKKKEFRSVYQLHLLALHQLHLLHNLTDLITRESRYSWSLTRWGWWQVPIFCWPISDREMSWWTLMGGLTRNRNFAIIRWSNALREFMFSVLTITLDSFLPSIVPPSCYSLAEYQNGIASDAGRLMNVVYN